jgi:hypothetical protein
MALPSRFATLGHAGEGGQAEDSWRRIVLKASYNAMLAVHGQFVPAACSADPLAMSDVATATRDFGGRRGSGYLRVRRGELVVVVWRSGNADDGWLYGERLVQAGVGERHRTIEVRGWIPAAFLVRLATVGMFAQNSLG